MNCFPDPDKHYYMFYKPFGCVTAHRDDLFPVVMDYFSELHNDRLSPVGRLDRETEGLLIVTDDGKWNQYMTNPEFHVPKTYEFAALGTLDARKLQRLAEGVLLTGSNIRRMLKVVGCCVIRLKRVSMGDTVLDDTLNPGDYREFVPEPTIEK